MSKPFEKGYQPGREGGREVQPRAFAVAGAKVAKIRCAPWDIHGDF